MALIGSFMILLIFIPSLSLHLEPVVRRYYSPFFARSIVPRPELRSVIETPRLQRLYVVKKKAQQIEKQIDSEIEQILQKQSYRRNFDNANDHLDSMPFFNPKPMDSYSAVIGAQGGTWYPGPAGAGVEGSRMLEGRASQEGLRRSQYRKTPNALGTARMVLQGQVRHIPAQSLQAKGFPRGLYPTIQSTPDPSEEMDRLGNPKEFDEKCTVLKLTFDKLNGNMVFDDSLQKNNMQLKDGAKPTKDRMDSGHSADLGDTGKMVLNSTFKGKPKESVAVSMWVKLTTIKGYIPLLTATDANNVSRHNLLLHDGKGLWVHRGDSGRELFSVQSSSPVINAGQWHNIVGTYNSVTKTASLWVDGKEVSKQEGINGVLSQRWSKLTIFGGKKAHGYIDNIFMFKCPLDKTKIVALYVSAASPKDVKKDV